MDAADRPHPDCSGDALTPSLVVEVAIHGHGLPHVFRRCGTGQRGAAGSACHLVSERVDLRDLPLVTIDGEDAGI